MSQEQTTNCEFDIVLISHTFGTEEIATLIFENEQQISWFVHQIRELNLTSGRNETEVHFIFSDYYSETFHNQNVDDLKEIIQRLFNETKKIY